NGNLVDEWETLVNPLREVGAAEIHGLTAADVYAAPTFDEILPELVSLLSGRMLVAHNLAFDARFLAAEFARAGHAVELDGSAGLCTMRVAEYYLPSRAKIVGGVL
ncbi:MAG: exonuclease domain-containing protein, partial [Limnochordia bacterium]